MTHDLNLQSLREVTVIDPADGLTVMTVTAEKIEIHPDVTPERLMKALARAWHQQREEVKQNTLAYQQYEAAGLV